MAAKKTDTPTTAVATLNVATPEFTAVKPPETHGLVAEYNASIGSLLALRVTDDTSYVMAKTAWSKVSNWVKNVESMFAPSCDAAFAAHRSVTGLRGMFTGPAEGVKSYLSGEIRSYESLREQERTKAEAELRRQQEEALRLQREEQARLEAEHRAAVAKAEAEHAAQQQAAADLDLWDDEPEVLPVFVPPPPPPPATVIFPPVPVPLPPSLPTVAGGPRTAAKPYAGRITDKLLFVTTALGKLSAGDPSMFDLLEVNAVKLNIKARELKNTLAEAMPGAEGFQDSTLRS